MHRSHMKEQHDGDEPITMRSDPARHPAACGQHPCPSRCWTPGVCPASASRPSLRTHVYDAGGRMALGHHDYRALVFWGDERLVPECSSPQRLSAATARAVVHRTHAPANPPERRGCLSAASCPHRGAAASRGDVRQTPHRGRMSSRPTTAMSVQTCTRRVRDAERARACIVPSLQYGVQRKQLTVVRCGPPALSTTLAPTLRRLW